METFSVVTFINVNTSTYFVQFWFVWWKLVNMNCSCGHKIALRF